jgi:2-dehydro-3-deoxygluconokinase
VTGTILCFGEMLLRLAAPDRGHLFQEARLDAHFGGAEANVAVALARIGLSASLITVLPHGPVGDGALEAVRAAGVDVSRVLRTDGRLGLYYLSPPSGLRGAHIVYDRGGSSFATTPPSAYDWSRALTGVEWLHLSGIIPALGPDAARLSQDAIAAARAMGVKVSFDVNFRASLWARWCTDPRPILTEHVAGADLLIGNHRDISLLLDREQDGETAAGRRAAALAAFARFDGLQHIASTARRVVDAETHHLLARVDRRDDHHETPAILIPQIVDRIGTGDAFAAGVLARLAEGCRAAAELGIALGVLNHATAGDQSRTTLDDALRFTGAAADVRR